MLTGSSTHPSLVLSHFSTFSFYFLASSLKQASYTKSCVSLCSGNPTITWRGALTSRFHMLFPLPLIILHLILTSSSGTCIKIISSGRRLWPFLSPNAEGSCCTVSTATMLTPGVNWKLQKRGTVAFLPSTACLVLYIHNGWHNTGLKNICGMNEIILEIVKKLPCKEPNTLYQVLTVCSLDPNDPILILIL